VAHTFGSTSQNKTRREVTTTTLIINSRIPCNWRFSIQLFIKVFDIRMIPIFTRQLAINIEASNVLGFSSNATILL
jgi:hypothetical protein